MRLFFVAFLLVFITSSFAYPLVMTNDKLVIDFSPSTTNLVYGLVNASIQQNPPRLVLTSSYGYFKITNIDIPTNELSYFDTIVISCDLKPGTRLYVDVLNADNGYIIAKKTIEFPQTSGIIDLKSVSKNVSSIKLVFSYDTTSPDGGKVNSIIIMRSFVLENAISDDSVIVYPNPFIQSPAGIVNMSIKLTSPNKVSIVVFDSKGNVVKTVLKDKEFEDGIYNFPWDLKDDRGKDVNSGTYVVFTKIGEKITTKKLYIVR